MNIGDLILSSFLVLTTLIGFVSNLCIHIQDGGRIIDMGMYLALLAVCSAALYVAIEEYRESKNKIK